MLIGSDSQVLLCRTLRQLILLRAREMSCACVFSWRCRDVLILQLILSILGLLFNS